MATIPTPIHQITAVLSVPNGYPNKLDLAKAILQKCTGNPHVTFTAGQITTMTTNIQTFEDRQTDVIAKVAGTVPLRNAAWAVVHTGLKEWQGIIQVAADADMANSEAIIVSTGMKVKKMAIPQKHSFKAKNNVVSGIADLSAGSAPKALSHEWAMSKDNLTWTQLASTPKGKTQVTGLIPLTKIYFRHRVLARTGFTAWEYTFLVIN